MSELSSQEFCVRLEEFLASHMPTKEEVSFDVGRAMRYSLLDGGKRIRPYLTYLVCTSLGGNVDSAIAFGAALEMLHTYSLIHDDLPCMDNDDFRRGRPSCHKAFGESAALLAGDGLLTHAFYTLSTSGATPGQISAATRLLAECAGWQGMIGGQATDLMAEKTQIDLETLRRLYDGKTAALIRAAVGLGCIASDVFEGEVWEAFDTCATQVGITFQIIDDILDVWGTEDLGKPLGSDAKNGKTTYLSFMSREEAEAEAQTRTEQAKKAVMPYVSPAFISLVDQLLSRKK